MIFRETKLQGAFIIEPELLEDERGFFARTFCRKEFEMNGLNPFQAQSSISYNMKKGTLRGLHYQQPPYAEVKVVCCTMGAIYDVILDIRPESPTFKRWAPFELSAENHHLLYIPEGFAHGFQTLQDHTEVYYQMSEFYHPEAAKGIRWNDPTFDITWPIEVFIISEKDRLSPDFS